MCILFYLSVQKIAALQMFDLFDLKFKLCKRIVKVVGYDLFGNLIIFIGFQGFMVQTGDPTGTGKGGQSIWGRKFEDEVRDDLKVQGEL